MYAITSKRALAWEGTWLGSVRFQEYVAADLARFDRIKCMFGKAEEVGSLLFGAEVSKKNPQKVLRRHGFFFIAHAPAVEKLLRERLVDTYVDQLYQ
jgi:hypothetical protein